MMGESNRERTWAEGDAGDLHGIWRWEGEHLNSTEKKTNCTDAKKAAQAKKRTQGKKVHLRERPVTEKKLEDRKSHSKKDGKIPKEGRRTG